MVDNKFYIATVLYLQPFWHIIVAQSDEVCLVVWLSNSNHQKQGVKEGPGNVEEGRGRRGGRGLGRWRLPKI